MQHSAPRICNFRGLPVAAFRWLSLLLMVTIPSALQARPAHEQKHESRRAIDQLEDEWRSAILKSDTAQMAALLADDYMGISSNGTLQTKGETLASLGSGRLHFTTLDISDRKVRFYGKTAVVTSRAEVEASTPDGNLSGSYRYTRVYAEDSEGQWKIVSFEASRIRDPSERVADHSVEGP